MRHRPRLDLTQREIVEALRQSGYSVRSLAGVGNGCPDILVGCQRGNVLMEAKSTKAQRGGKKPELSDSERSFFTTWTGPVALVFTADEARHVMRVYMESGQVPPRELTC